MGLTMRVARAEGYEELRDAISHDWLLFLSENGLDPCLIPNVSRNGVPLCEQRQLDLLLLSNGNDIGDFPLRDKNEFALLEYAREKKIPVLGVCRGMQMINTFFGGQVIPVQGHVALEHSVRLKDPGFIRRWESEEIRTNSYHRQGVTPQTLAAGLEAFALADDGIVEGLFHHKLPILGVQWHPERDPSPDRFHQELLRDWMERRAWTG